MIGKKAIAGMAAGISLFAVALPLSVIGKAEPKLGSVEFSAPLSVQEAMDLVKGKMQPTKIEHEFTANGEVVTGGIEAIPGESPSDTEKRLKEGMKNFVEFRASLTPQSDVSPEVKASQKSQIDSFKALKKRLPEIRVKKMEGLSEDFSSMKNSPQVQKVDVKPEENFGSKLQSFLFPTPKKAFAAPETECWMPEYNTTYSNGFSNGNRYVDQELSWDRVCWGLWATFEPDFFTYNYYANGNYYDIRESGYMPVNQYWASNLPYPYLDTRYDDDTRDNPKGQRNEVAYTIGSAYANNIGANKNYYTYIETVKGTKDFDKAKFNGQYGIRKPSSCFSTWCSFGEVSVWYSNNPSWSFALPGSKSVRF